MSIFIVISVYYFRKNRCLYQDNIFIKISTRDNRRLKNNNFFFHHAIFLTLHIQKQKYESKIIFYMDLYTIDKLSLKIS